jgi:hypothetical protein
MPRYFLHVVDGKFLRDEEGQEFTGLDHAKAEAVASARSIMREAIWGGRLPLNESIQITDEQGAVLLEVPFRSVVEID